MELRNGSLVGGSTGQLQQQLRPVFEEGVKLVLSRWTALCLAVENEWGGRSSREKADQLYTDILNWFYDNSGEYVEQDVAARPTSACWTCQHMHVSCG